MKKITLTIFISTISLFIACKSTKNTVATTPVTTSPTGSTARNPSGIIMPTNEQVLAVRAKYPNVTIDELKEGYKTYTGACTNCHGAKNIHQYNVSQWADIIDDMSPKAYLSTTEKDKLTKYIMSIKSI